MNQKDVFLNSEGDAWFERNRQSLAAKVWPDDDALLGEILALDAAQSRDRRVLEIGCGEGLRLEWLQRTLGWQCFGVEPSAKAVEVACARGLDVRQGTADGLPFADGSADIVIFGFCLYLCEPADLFRVAAEADRVLRAPGWMLIEDFYSPNPRTREYHHRSGLKTHKMDFRTQFTWHPYYECLTHLVRHHETRQYTDLAEDWVAVSVLRKSA